MQTRIADFFHALSSGGVQCIVETHSEHIINRLRYRAVSASADQSTEDQGSVLIHFAEQDHDGTHYRELTINEYGVIEDWPSGFFDEAEIESSLILQAGIAKIRSHQHDAGDDLDDDDDLFMTKVGVKIFQDELKTLKSQRVDIIESIRLAAKDQDLRNNPRLDAARENQYKAEARIRGLEQALRHAVIIDDDDDDDDEK